MMILFDQEIMVRTTLTIDDELFAQALALSEPGIGKSELLRKCVKAYIQKQTARRLAALGGKASDVDPAPRRPARHRIAGGSNPNSDGPVR